MSGIIAPVPVLDCQSTVVVGSEYMFDATGSTDDTEIVSYSFDFGDGTAVVKNEKGKTLHIFDKTGKCKVTVSVTDSDGNTTKLTKEITVTSRELVGTVNVLLKDERAMFFRTQTLIWISVRKNSSMHLPIQTVLPCLKLRLNSHCIFVQKDYFCYRQGNLCNTRSCQ